MKVSEVTYLRHLVNKKRIRLKDVYYLIIQSSIKNREAKQSRYLHDNKYDTNMNGLCHRYLELE